MPVFAIGTDENRKDDNELLQLRIQAKAELWNFINDISGEIINWQSSKEELAEEISKTAIRILHPHFTAPELQNEVINILDTFKVKQPENFLSMHSTDVIDMILAKLKWTAR